MKTSEKIISILKELISDEEIKSKISNDTSITNDVGLDSLGMINFILKLEDTFSIEIDYETFNYSHLNSVNKLCEFIETQKSTSV